MIPPEILAAMRGRFAHHKLAGLQAVTFHERSDHLRIDFFFAGSSEDVDLDELEAGTLSELIGDVWAGVDTVGFAVFFDDPSTRQALVDPLRLYPAP
jgi:hypothetical protein